MATTAATTVATTTAGTHPAAVESTTGTHPTAMETTTGTHRATTDSTAMIAAPGTHPAAVEAAMVAASAHAAAAKFSATLKGGMDSSETAVGSVDSMLPKGVHVAKGGAISSPELVIVSAERVRCKGLSVGGAHHPFPGSHRRAMQPLRGSIALTPELA